MLREQHKGIDIGLRRQREIEREGERVKEGEKRERDREREGGEKDRDTSKEIERCVMNLSDKP